MIIIIIIIIITNICIINQIKSKILIYNCEYWEIQGSGTPPPHTQPNPL